MEDLTLSSNVWDDKTNDAEIQDKARDKHINNNYKK